MSGVRGSKIDLGTAKRKRKKLELALIDTMKGSLLKHLKRSTGDENDEPTLHTDIAAAGHPVMPDVQVF